MSITNTGGTTTYFTNGNPYKDGPGRYEYYCQWDLQNAQSAMNIGCLLNGGIEILRGRDQVISKLTPEDIYSEMPREFHVWSDYHDNHNGSVTIGFDHLGSTNISTVMFLEIQQSEAIDQWEGGSLIDFIMAFSDVQVLSVQTCANEPEPIVETDEDDELDEDE